jgi:nucleotide-binding universal stress UspA family protein
MVASILVPLDGSTISEAALGPAHSLAAAFDVPLILFRACWSDAGEARDELQELAEKVAGHPAGIAVGHGFAGPAIIRELTGHPGSVACMTTRGHTGAGALLRGSVAGEVITGAPGPVVLIGPECSPLALNAPSGGTLVLGYDGSDAATALVPTVAEWALALDLEVHLVTVVHDHGEKVDDLPSPPVRARATELADALREAGVAARTAFPEDRDAADALIAYADEQHAVLIAAAPARHAHDLSHAVLGSTALRVVRHATVPVLVTRVQ